MYWGIYIYKNIIFIQIYKTVHIIGYIILCTQIITSNAAENSCGEEQHAVHSQIYITNRKQNISLSLKLVLIACLCRPHATRQSQKQASHFVAHYFRFAPKVMLPLPLVVTWLRSIVPLLPADSFVIPESRRA